MVGGPKYIERSIQSAQLEAARISIGKKTQIWSTKQLLNEMGWDSLENNLILSSVKMTHIILTDNIPKIIAHRIKSRLPPPPVQNYKFRTGQNWT